jgi:hypothetical protein
MKPLEILHLENFSLKILLPIFLLPFLCYSQKQITNQSLVWYGLFQTVELNEKWYIKTKIQERHFIKPIAQHQFVLRSHLHYLIPNTNWNISGGLCYFLQSSNVPEVKSINMPELRPHIELANSQKLKFFSLNHRYKFEARYFHETNEDRTQLDEGYSFSNYRLRYQLQATIPMLKMNNNMKLKSKISNEIFLNAGKNVTNVFDQNRVYLGFSLDTKHNLTFDLGYLNWFQQKNNKNFVSRDIIRFSITHKFKL